MLEGLKREEVVVVGVGSSEGGEGVILIGHATFFTMQCRYLNSIWKNYLSRV